VTRTLERLDFLRDRSPGVAGQGERLHGLLKRQDSLIDRTLERKVTRETKHLEKLDSWSDSNPGKTEPLSDRTPGKAGQVERWHGLLEIQDSWTDRTLEKKVAWRNYIFGDTGILETQGT
jgi:hypothetical protein